MADNSKVKPSTRMGLRLTGIGKELIDELPDGKKSIFINQLLCDSLFSGRMLQTYLVVFGQKDGNKLHKRALKMAGGITIDTEVSQNGSQLINKNEQKMENTEPLFSMDFEQKNNTKTSRVDSVSDEDNDLEIEFDFDK